MLLNRNRHNVLQNKFIGISPVNSKQTNNIYSKYEKYSKLLPYVGRQCDLPPYINV